MLMGASEGTVGAPKTMAFCEGQGLAAQMDRLWAN